MALQPRSRTHQPYAQNLPPVLDLIMKTKRNAFKPINSILYRCTEVDREERYALRSVEVYMCLELSYIDYLQKHADIFKTFFH